MLKMNVLIRPHFDKSVQQLLFDRPKVNRKPTVNAEGCKSTVLG